VTRRRIAVIGGGVSGITAGYVLSHTDDVTLFEADSRLGGHADTHMVVPPAGPPIGVDTGCWPMTPAMTAPSVSSSRTAAFPVTSRLTSPSR
jgi:predicted NAD/FAD-binding protein